MLAISSHRCWPLILVGSLTSLDKHEIANNSIKKSLGIKNWGIKIINLAMLVRIMTNTTKTLTLYIDSGKRQLLDFIFKTK